MSITNLRSYGNPDPLVLSDDIKKLRDIYVRQGSALIIDVIAEITGETANKFNMSAQDRNNVMLSLVHDLSSALSERL